MLWFKSKGCLLAEVLLPSSLEEVRLCSINTFKRLDEAHSRYGEQPALLKVHWLKMLIWSKNTFKGISKYCLTKYLGTMALTSWHIKWAIHMAYSLRHCCWGFLQLLSHRKSALNMKAKCFYMPIKWLASDVTISEENKLVYINSTNLKYRVKYYFRNTTAFFISVILFKETQGLYWSVGLCSYSVKDVFGVCWWSYFLCLLNLHFSWLLLLSSFYPDL